MHMRATRAILAAGLICAGPAGAVAEPAKAINVVFTCPNDRTLTVAFLTAAGAEQAVVRPSNGPAVTLPVQISGSGFRYADAAHELRGKGREVTWTEGRANPIVCTASD
jgi:membrane-bound inhibitor of C-type lysozyme